MGTTELHEDYIFLTKNHDHVDEDVNILVQIAHEIWSDHFGTMFDTETLRKLIEGTQSKKTTLTQIENGYQYFFIIED